MNQLRQARWSDIKNMVEKGELDFFYKQPEYKKENLIYKDISLEKISANLKSVINVLEKLKDELVDIIKNKKIKNKINYDETIGKILSISIFSPRFCSIIAMASLMMVSVLNPRKSIFRSPALSATELSN